MQCVVDGVLQGAGVNCSKGRRDFSFTMQCWYLEPVMAMSE